LCEDQIKIDVVILW